MMEALEAEARPRRVIQPPTPPPRPSGSGAKPTPNGGVFPGSLPSGGRTCISCRPSSLRSKLFLMYLVRKTPSPGNKSCDRFGVQEGHRPHLRPT
ncbi:hypothetical protein GDO78_016354 [Eleutherodactylus coqui]|uniref:Uncharacterized protein n=1 Tax=Eleutherodactylus coqui TaxID=57060 RepID=A0A8J6E6B0_ELECQ|nr:hypothetical protein GDO78_016354 [Eleutherodactylus coqui]